MITIKSRCEEFEGELASIREDVIDSLEDGWVVKSVRRDHHHSHVTVNNSIEIIANGWVVKSVRRHPSS